MTRSDRQLLVSAEQCIGCRACTVVCPAGLIALNDTDQRRTVRFAALCGEDCDRCVGACPTGAIRLQPAPKELPDRSTELGFELRTCSACGAVVATARMIAGLRDWIPAQMQTDAGGQAWLDLCPLCRRDAEARRVAHEGIMTRF